jgi:hypothetical protein
MVTREIWVRVADAREIPNARLCSELVERGVRTRLLPLADDLGLRLGQ